MQKIRLTVGRQQTTSSGAEDYRTRSAEFVAERVGEYRELGTGRDGRPTDTRGTIQVLYRAEDGRLVVHIQEWSKWQGEPTIFSLVQAGPADFEPGGRFYDLGVESGVEQSRPLTLDEALADCAKRDETPEE